MDYQKILDMGYLKEDIELTYDVKLPDDLEPTCDNYYELVAERYRPYLNMTKLRTKLLARYKNRLAGILTKQINISNFKDYFGYTVDDLILHLVDQGMGFELDESKHIDHINPCKNYKINSIHDGSVKECFALSNIQLLSKEDHLKKSADMRRKDIKRGK